MRFEQPQLVPPTCVLASESAPMPGPYRLVEGDGVGDDVADVKRTVTAYRYDLPYSDITLFPLMALIRYQVWLDTVRPSQLARHDPPDTVPTTVTYVPE
jgi:hypothetical protein